MRCQDLSTRQLSASLQGHRRLLHQRHRVLVVMILEREMFWMTLNRVMSMYVFLANSTATIIMSSVCDEVVK